MAADRHGPTVMTRFCSCARRSDKPRPKYALLGGSVVRRSVAVRASENEWQHGSNDCSGKESECSECGECNECSKCSECSECSERSECSECSECSERVQ